MLYVRNYGSINGTNGMPFRKDVETQKQGKYLFFKITISKVWDKLHVPLEFTLPYCQLYLMSLRMSNLNVVIAAPYNFGNDLKIEFDECIIEYLALPTLLAL